MRAVAVRLRHAALAALAFFVACHAALAGAPRVEVDQAKFRLDLGDGRILEGDALVGVILHLRDGRGRPLEIRIDSLNATAGQSAAGLELYGLSRRDDQGRWSPLCKPGADNRALGFPLAADAADDEAAGAGAGFSLACTAGARGKCVMLGYLPWVVAASGQSLRPYFESCVHMMRADYCGDGAPHTHPGIRIDLWDRAGIRSAVGDMPFEAAWGPQGAVCLARVRVPALASLERILAGCPRLARILPASCEAGSQSPDSAALLWNRSPSP